MDLGLSQTTAARARDNFAAKFYPQDATTPAFLVGLTEVIERFHTRGHWVGARSTFSVGLPEDGLLYLPFYLDSILGVRIDTRPITPRTPSFEYLHDGPGEINPDEGFAGFIIDQGLSPLSTTYPDTPGKLRFTLTDPDDVGKKVRVLGTDENGVRVVNTGVPGEEVLLADPTVETTTTFASIQGIQKDLTEAAVTVEHIGTTDTLLTTMESFMEVPLYRCYKSATPESSYEAIHAYCKRRPIPVRNEEDFLLPGNLSALKLGMFALNYEEKNDLERASQYWAEAEEQLNNEAIEYRGVAQEQINFSPWGTGVSGIFRVR